MSSMASVYGAKTWRSCVQLGMAVLLLASSGCATIQGEPAPYDPLERLNRTMFDFNDSVDEYVLKPVATGYKAITPEFVRNRVGNFFSNLFEPTIIINDLLQGKIVAAFGDTGRFLINTTMGIGGLFDVATPMGFVKHEEDFGQTLGAWGIPAGPYLVLPFLGPKNLRDGVGWAGDWATGATTHVEPSSAAWGAFALEVVDIRARMLGTKDVLQQAAAGDQYIFVREAYRQRRLNLVHDGNPPAENGAAEDELLFGK
ncbi:MAG: VacJ family lipoprotein [Gammaproteobacteria bacterium]|nr:VacJ family lipoprotein [Gammaproteobacteria bacterium]